MENNQYTSLGKLVGQQFTVKSVKPYVWKMWSQADNRFISSDTYKDGFQKKYPLETDKGILELGTGKMGEALEAIVKDGVADLRGKTFLVKSNGKEKLDVRYFLNPVKDFEPEPSQTGTVTEQGDIEVDPFEGLDL